MKKVTWTLEKIKIGFEAFYKEHNRYPTALEFDTYDELPSSRQIQRRFGGLVEIRKTLKLDGPTDFTKGAYSSERATAINKRANKTEKEVYDYLVDQFGTMGVHREFMFFDDKRTRTDFFVYTKKGNFCIDVFYPKDLHNLVGCINSKMKTYSGDEMLKYPVIFLMMNPDITEEEIEQFVQNKKNKLNAYQKVMTLAQLKQFCKGRGRYSVA
jgi:hypothetical protein